MRDLTNMNEQELIDLANDVTASPEELATLYHVLFIGDDEADNFQIKDIYTLDKIIKGIRCNPKTPPAILTEEETISWLMIASATRGLSNGNERYYTLDTSVEGIICNFKERVNSYCEVMEQLIKNPSTPAEVKDRARKGLEIYGQDKDSTITSLSDIKRIYEIAKESGYGYPEKSSADKITELMNEYEIVDEEILQAEAMVEDPTAKPKQEPGDPAK